MKNCIRHFIEPNIAIYGDMIACYVVFFSLIKTTGYEFSTELLSKMLI